MIYIVARQLRLFAKARIALVADLATAHWHEQMQDSSSYTKIAIGSRKMAEPVIKLNQADVGSELCHSLDTCVGEPWEDTDFASNRHVRIDQPSRAAS